MVGPTFHREKKLRMKEAGNLDCWVERPSRQKLYNWTKWGLNGVILESEKQGGLRYTTRESVARFLARTR